MRFSLRCSKLGTTRDEFPQVRGDLLDERLQVAGGRSSGEYAAADLALDLWVARVLLIL